MINKKRLISLTQKMISINSENPPGREVALARFISKDMKSLGLEVRTYSFVRNRPNVVAVLRGTLPRKEARRGAILLTPHFDTVPIGKGWRYEPLRGEIVRGRIYGRGATDDKGNTACCMEMMRSLVEDKVQLKKDVVMAATVDEETGSHVGLIPLLEKGILRPKFAVVMDSDEFDVIIAQKGLIHARVQIFGKKAHGAYNWLGISAVETAARIITQLKKMKFRYKRHPILCAPTINIGVIQGGDKVNMVADFCEFTIDCRFLPGMDPRQIIKRMRSLIGRESQKFKMIVTDVQQPYEMDHNHPCIRKYMQIVQENGCRAVLKGSEGATVITFFKKYKIPAFATGFGAHGTAHTNDEYVRIQSLFKGTQVLERFVREHDLL